MCLNTQTTTLFKPKFCLCYILSVRSFKLAIFSFICTASSFESTSIWSQPYWFSIFLNYNRCICSLCRWIILFLNLVAIFRGIFSHRACLGLFTLARLLAEGSLSALLSRLPFVIALWLSYRFSGSGPSLLSVLVDPIIFFFLFSRSYPRIGISPGMMRQEV